LEVAVRKDLDIDRIQLFTAKGKETEQLCINGLNRLMCTTTNNEGRIKNTFQLTDNEIH
jgi:hypothetical protein